MVDVYNTTLRDVLKHYRRHWFRWTFDPSWRKLAWVDAIAQANRTIPQYKGKPFDDAAFQKRAQEQMQARVSESVTRRFADLAE